MLRKFSKRDFFLFQINVINICYDSIIQWLKWKISGRGTVQSGVNACWLGLPYTKYEVGNALILKLEVGEQLAQEVIPSLRPFLLLLLHPIAL